MNGLRETQAGQKGRKLQNTLNKGDLMGVAAEMIDRSATRRKDRASWVMDLEGVWI